MDQLPVEISQRIRHEARVAGLNEHAPSIEMVERRRLQLWSMTIVIMIGIGLASLAVSGATGQTSWITGDPWILAGGVSVLAVGFCIYAVEKEVHLHRLSRLLVDERLLSNTMAQQLQMNTALFNAGKALNSVLDLDEVLDAILANALELLGSMGGSVMLLEDQSVLRVVAVRGEGTVRDARVRLGESMVGRVAKSREPLLVSPELATAELGGAVQSDVEIGGAMCVPLVNRGQLLGVLNVLAPKGIEFEADDLAVLSLFAEPVAAAIAKAGLYEAERANVAKLLESDRMKSQFVASVSHELRTPITSIRGAVAASRRTDRPDQREELLDVVDRQSGRLQAMVEEMLVAARMQENANRPTMQQIDLCALVQLTARLTGCGSAGRARSAADLCGAGRARGAPASAHEPDRKRGQVRQRADPGRGPSHRRRGGDVGDRSWSGRAARRTRSSVRTVLPSRPQRDEAGNGIGLVHRARTRRVLRRDGLGGRRSGRGRGIPGRATDQLYGGVTTGGLACLIGRRS